MPELYDVVVEHEDGSTSSFLNLSTSDLLAVLNTMPESSAMKVVIEPSKEQ